MANGSKTVSAEELEEAPIEIVETVLPNYIPADEIYEEIPEIVEEPVVIDILPNHLVYNGEVLPDCPYWYIFDQYGMEFGISPELLAAMSFYESSFNADMHKGSYSGLFSLSRVHCKPYFDRVQGIDWNDPADNTRTACEVLSEFFERYEDTHVVLHRFHGEPEIFKQPSGYATRIMTLAEKYEFARGKR